MQKGAHIPDEVIIDVLRSLPAKSLVRFKCVCKSWLSLISQLRYDNEELILHTSFCFHSIDFKESEIKQVMLGFPLRNSLNSLDATVDSTVVGSCNGLLCVRNRGDAVCIWNPWTRRYKMVSSETKITRSTNNSGFGYDHSTDDYIIVKFIYNHERRCIVEVYSRKADSWFQMGKLPQQILPNAIVWKKQKGLFANGALYWHVNYVENKDVGVVDNILCFNLVDRKFSMIVPPNDHEKKPDFDIGVLGGRFCMIDYDHDCHSDIWAWEGNNNKKGSNWIKLMSIPSNNYKFLAPVFLMKNGEVLLRIIEELYMNPHARRRRHVISLYPEGEKKLFIYSQKHKTLRELTISYKESLSNKEITYTRSLVSPASNDGDDLESPLCYEADFCRNLGNVGVAARDRMVEWQQHSTTTATNVEYKQVKPEICEHLWSEFGPHCKSSTSRVSLQWTIELDPM
ncbi:hypothetical protein EZV62_028078 [Acer yangbiense]|uniref:F-box domain-containing protein n=1 Tax=Acer yangbiense TaxID=1000413 RepID=A0A5C7GNP1_9ROSI|nr:hypothetical protein EZV62_028078 [Acer yangbiense]